MFGPYSNHAQNFVKSVFLRANFVVFAKESKNERIKNSTRKEEPRISESTGNRKAVFFNSITSSYISLALLI